MRPKDYLFYLLGIGDDPDAASSIITQQSLLPIQKGFYEVALLAATEADAIQACKAIHDAGKRSQGVLKLRQSRHRFEAIGLDAPWPTRRFHELHWLCGHIASPADIERLKGLADIIHVHHLQPVTSLSAPGVRVYQWRKEQDIFDFWHALYAARDNPNSFGLDWGSYANWSPQQLMGRYTSAQAKSPLQALQHLQNHVRLSELHDAQEALLVVKYKSTLSLGEYAQVVGTLESLLGCEITPALDLTEMSEGCSLKLLAFSRK